MGIIGALLNFLIVICSLFLICLVLIQRGRGGGLAGAFGGMGGSSAFGTKAGDVFTRVTVVTAVIWFLLAMALVVKNNQGPTSAFATDDSDGRQVAPTDVPAGSKAATGTTKTPATTTTPPAPGTGANVPATPPAATRTGTDLPDVFVDDDEASPADPPTGTGTTP